MADDRRRCERFNELPDSTKVFLAGLTEQKIDRIEKGIKLAEAAETIGKFWKWIAILAVTAFAGIATIAAGFEVIRNWFRGTP